MKNNFPFILLITLASVIILWNIGTGSLLSWDECLYGQVSREMYMSGNWIDLTWMHKPWSDKPPLYMWVTVLFFKLFGVSELAVRLFSALCGIGTVALTYLLGQRLYNRNAGIAASLLLLSTWHFIWGAKIGMLDATFTFFVTLSLYLFVIGEEEGRYLIFSMLAFAAAFLAKGITALIIPAILFVYVIAAGKAFLLRKRALWLGVVFALFAIGIWHGLALLHYGKQFAYDYFIRHLFLRSTQVLEGHAGTGTWYSYLEAIPNKGRPWGGWGLAALVILAWQVMTKKGKPHRLAFTWAIVTLVLFSVAKTKNHWYIIPIYPALSLLAGSLIAKGCKRFTVIVVTLLCAAALVYLALDKRIFNLDYAPDTKRMALSAKQQLSPGQKVYFYKLTDPGVLFYFGDVFEDLPETRLSETLGQSDRFIALERNTLPMLPADSYVVAAESKDFAVIRTSAKK